MTHLGLPHGDLDSDGDIDADDIRTLTKENAAALYRKQWWDRYKYWLLPDNIDWKVFDLAVNMGPRQAHKILQRALRSCEQKVEVDGLFGPETIRAARIVPWHCLFTALRSEAAGFYRSLVFMDPSREVFLKGWLNRAYA